MAMQRRVVLSEEPAEAWTFQAAQSASMTLERQTETKITLEERARRKRMSSTPETGSRTMKIRASLARNPAVSHLEEYANKHNIDLKVYHKTGRIEKRASVNPAGLHRMGSIGLGIGRQNSNLDLDGSPAMSSSLSPGPESRSVSPNTPKAGGSGNILGSTMLGGSMLLGGKKNEKIETEKRKSRRLSISPTAILAGARKRASQAAPAIRKSDEVETRQALKLLKLHEMEREARMYDECTINAKETSSDSSDILEDTTHGEVSSGPGEARVGLKKKECLTVSTGSDSSRSSDEMKDRDIGDRDGSKERESGDKRKKKYGPGTPKVKSVLAEDRDSDEDNSDTEEGGEKKGHDKAQERFCILAKTSEDARALWGPPRNVNFHRQRTGLDDSIAEPLQGTEVLNPATRRRTLSAAAHRVSADGGKEAYQRDTIQVLLPAIESGETTAYILDPQAWYIRAWQVWVCLVVVYVSIMISLSVGIGWWIPSRVVQISWFIVDGICIIDMFLTFRLGFVRQGHIIRDPHEIADNYVKGMFFPDLLANIPFEYIIVGLAPSQRKSVKLFKWLKVPRLLRLSQLRKILKGNFRWMNLLIALFIFGGAVHLGACFWILALDPCDGYEVEFPDWRIGEDVNEDLVLKNANFGWECTQDRIPAIYMSGLSYSSSVLFGNHLLDYTDGKFYSNYASNAALSREVRNAQDTILQAHYNDQKPYPYSDNERENISKDSYGYVLGMMRLYRRLPAIYMEDELSTMFWFPEGDKREYAAGETNSVSSSGVRSSVSGAGMTTHGGGSSSSSSSSVNSAYTNFALRDEALRVPWNSTDVAAVLRHQSKLLADMVYGTQNNSTDIEVNVNLKLVDIGTVSETTDDSDSRLAVQNSTTTIVASSTAIASIESVSVASTKAIAAMAAATEQEKCIDTFGSQGCELISQFPQHLEDAAYLYLPRNSEFKPKVSNSVALLKTISTALLNEKTGNSRKKQSADGAMAKSSSSGTGVTTTPSADVIAGPLTTPSTSIDDAERYVEQVKGHVSSNSGTSVATTGTDLLFRLLLRSLYQSQGIDLPLEIEYGVSTANATQMAVNIQVLSDNSPVEPAKTQMSISRLLNYVKLNTHPATLLKMMKTSGTLQDTHRHHQVGINNPKMGINKVQIKVVVNKIGPRLRRA